MAMSMPYKMQKMKFSMSIQDSTIMPWWYFSIFTRDSTRLMYCGIQDKHRLFQALDTHVALYSAKWTHFNQKFTLHRKYTRYLYKTNTLFYHLLRHQLGQLSFFPATIFPELAYLCILFILQITLQGQLQNK